MMKTAKIVFFILLILFEITSYADKVSKERAKTIAENWGERKLGKSGKEELGQTDYSYGKDTLLYIFNFGENGFAIVPADDNTYPILAYSYTEKFDLNNLSSELESWLNYYSEMIKFERTIDKSSEAKEKWNELESGTHLKSVMTTVPSLLESTGSSRWATWNPYFSKAPDTQDEFDKGYNGCVPLAMSQIMKYHAFPPIGTGSKTYTFSGTSLGTPYSITISENLNQYFGYSLMPFRLTYCGNGQTNCNEGSFDTIPGTTQQQINEIGKLQYLAGVSVETRWLGMRDTSSYPTGTYNTPNEWVQAMVNYFHYDSDFTYWNETRINNDSAGFKDSLRSNIDSNLPVLFRYGVPSGGGHAIVIDGYDNNDFFHFCSGRGGYTDGYFYLFSSDSDGTHSPREYITSGGLRCAMNIHPDCDIDTNISLDNATISSSSVLYRATNNISISNTTLTSGAKVYFGADNSVSIISSFYVELGAELLIDNKPCGND